MGLRESQAAHWAGKKMNVIQSYWDSPPATKRSMWFVEQLKNYEFDSIFEVGFFSGRNLKYIGDEFPNVRIGGLEINEKAVKFAHEKLPEADLRCMDLHNIMQLDDSFDIIFTSGVLIHVPPENIVQVVDNFIALAGKYVMHIESVGENHVTAGPKKMSPTYKVSDQIQWAPNLISAYKTLGFKNIDIISLPEDCKTNGASELVVVKL